MESKFRVGQVVQHKATGKRAVVTYIELKEDRYDSSGGEPVYELSVESFASADVMGVRESYLQAIVDVV